MKKYYPYVVARAGKTADWSPSDIKDQYKEKQPNGQPNLYTTDSIKYKYNSHGFRCDEFSLETDLSVVFIGCSVTEGIGVNQHEIWASHVLNKIKDKTKKEIAYWNLALGGTGIDTSANTLYWFSKLRKIDYIIAKFPPMFRREFTTTYGACVTWGAWSNPSSLDPVFSDVTFQGYQTRRSFMILDSIRRINNSTMYCSFWPRDERHEFLKIEFPEINFGTYQQLPMVDYGRDGIHPGPESHRQLAEGTWEDLEKYF